MWETMLKLRELMKRVVMVEGNRVEDNRVEGNRVEGNWDDQADQDRLYDAIRKVATAPSPTTDLFRINANNMRKVLSEAERIWMMTVLPAVYEQDWRHARDKSGTPAVLLAVVRYQATSSPGQPGQIEIVEVDMASSPYLLQTQVFQGLPIAYPSSVETPKRVINFVTVTPQPASSKTQAIELWFHLDARVSGAQTTFAEKPPGLNVLAELADGKLKEVKTTALTGTPKNNVYTVTLTLDAAIPTSHLRFVFDLSDVKAIDPQAPTPTPGKKGKADTESGVPIMTYLANEGLALEGYVPGEGDAPGTVIVFVRNTAAATTTTTPVKQP